MVLLHILAKDEQQSNEIVDILVENKLILEAVILEKIVVKRKDKSHQLVSSNRILIMGKTKALLFNYIDELLKEKYKKNMPILYSVPIVNMDWEQANKLVKETAKV